VNKGAWGEERGARWLTQKGFKILKRNFRSAGGEVDIIGSDGDEIVFVEVKCWDVFEEENLEFSISKHKQKNIIRASKAFLSQQDLLDQYVRYDVLLITGNRFYHYKYAFSEF